MSRLSEIRKERIKDLTLTGHDLADAINRAYREIPEGASASSATVANEADARNRQALIARRDAAKEKLAKAREGMRAAFPGADEVWIFNQTCAANPTIANDAMLKIPPPLEKTADGTQYSDGRGYPGPSSDASMPTPPWLKNFGAGASNTTNGQGVPWADIERLQLPVDVSIEEWQAAKSCGSTDPAKIFDCLAKWASRTRNISLPAATWINYGRFPKLARAANIAPPPMAAAALQASPPVPGQS
jgi:hypothetical protein